ncbi:MAG: UDP-N-acetylmuramoyl-L-alanyl-D-glutamate--2,6-diaminopimelate ligase [Clostridia bacterium]|nr:UDP-N-acetylmuramoyl-L-alanyl-D-glutamate--2,6-diaminopimelate ligase [Clostridia bacterium]
MKLCQLLPCSYETEIKSVVVDSREVQQGSLFVCISGVKVDGHQFAQKAVEQGAVALVAERELDVSVPVVIVENTRQVLPSIISAFLGHPEKSFRLIGVTGTNGKTSSTHFLKSILEAEGRKVGLIGTNHNLIGETELPSTHTTPDSISLFQLFRKMADMGAQDVVMEISSHALDQHRADTHFAAAAITNLSQDHLDYHKTMDAYAEAKKRLFTMSDYKVYNADDVTVCQMLDGFSNTASFGIEQGDFRATEIVNEPSGVRFKVGDMAISLAVPWRFSVYNALLAIALAKGLGCSDEAIVRGLDAVSGVSGRAEVVKTDLPFTLLIDYAHTPDGIEKILTTAREFTKNELWVLFGCGGDRDRTKRPKMGAMAEALADRLIVTSDNPRSEDPEAIIEEILVGIGDKSKAVVLPDRTDAIAYAIQHAKEGDVVVLAGKGHETYQVLKDGTIHYDEREVISQLLEA